MPTPSQQLAIENGKKKQLLFFIYEPINNPIIKKKNLFLFLLLFHFNAGASVSSLKKKKKKKVFKAYLFILLYNYLK